MHGLSLSFCKNELVRALYCHSRYGARYETLSRLMGLAVLGVLWVVVVCVVRCGELQGARLGAHVGLDLGLGLGLDLGQGLGGVEGQEGVGVGARCGLQLV